MSKSYDFVIVGAGIVGLSVARALVQRGFKKIAILEKESELGVHTSGRNSGVLHAGIYYAQDSLKAKFCIEGSRSLQEFARERKISCLKTGKVIVASSEREHGYLLNLFERAKLNCATVAMIDSKTLKEIEPEAFTFHQAIHSPETAVIDSKAVLEALRLELSTSGVQIFTDAEVTEVDENELRLKNGEKFRFGHLVNSAGLQADRIAAQLGVGKNYKILPFKGLYRELLSPSREKIRGSIYPVPDPSFPFLGVHITRSAMGKVLLGPTAIPAFGRENYGVFSGLDATDTPRIFWGLSKMIARNTDGIRSLVRDEMGKYSQRGFWSSVRKLAPSIRRSEISGFVKVGLRAQLVRNDNGRLEMDFKIETTKTTTHILNAISPGFTCSLPFGNYVVEGILSRAWPLRQDSDNLAVR